jgi:hypothetical protein
MSCATSFTLIFTASDFLSNLQQGVFEYVREMQESDALPADSPCLLRCLLLHLQRLRIISHGVRLTLDCHKTMSNR